MHNIEDLLSDFYAQLREEYNAVQTEVLYKQYVESDVRERLMQNEVRGFGSKDCFPKHWRHPIQLCVYCEDRIEIKLQSPVDLRLHVDYLVHDANFKELVMVAFYIMDNVNPREIPL